MWLLGLVNWKDLLYIITAVVAMNVLLSQNTKQDTQLTQTT